jgi:hypothetical protein
LRFIIALSTSAAVNVLAFSLVQTQSLLQAIALACTVLIATFVALTGWYRSTPGILLWDGQHWHWSGFVDQSKCVLSLKMDLQRVLLVSLRCEGQPVVWLWLDACADIHHWSGLRRAIVSSRGVSMDEDALTSQEHGEVA